MSRYHLWSSWGGGIFVILFGIGWCLLAGLAPPPLSPALSAAEIASFYQTNTNMIRLGLSVVMLGCAALVPFYAALSIQMSRMEGRWPILSIAQVALGLSNVLFFVIPVVFWQAAAFRPDRDPEVIRTLNDLGWLIIMWPFSLASMQNLVIAAAILSDRNSPPVFPRWMAFFNLWVALLLAAGVLIPFFKTGPFAWDGLFGFWLPASVYLLWIALSSFILARAIIAHVTSSRFTDKPEVDDVQRFNLRR